MPASNESSFSRSKEAHAMPLGMAAAQAMSDWIMYLSSKIRGKAGQGADKMQIQSRD